MAGYKPHSKQTKVHLAFLTQGYKRGVYLAGRQCLAVSTPVLTKDGYKPVSDVEIGDFVLSYGKNWEYKAVIDKLEYGVNVEPKPMLEFMIDEETIRTTYDHPFYYNEEYVPIYQLAWRSMEASQRNQLELLCEQYGQVIDYSSTWLGGQSGQQARRELRNSYLKREASPSDTQGYEEKERDSQRLRGQFLHDLRDTDSQNLVSHIRVSECEPTISIEVEDNHNYTISEANILVANSGKTYFATQHSWLSATIEQGRYFVVFKTYKQAHEVVWRQYVPLIPKELVYKTNENDLLIELNYVKGPVTLPDGTTIEVQHDESKPRSSIQLLGSDQADSHRGFKANGIIFDEYADQDPNNWDAVYKHFFTTTDGWALFMGTPRGYNHFYDLIQYARDDERWFYLEATWRDSPYVKKEYIEQERAEAEKRGTLSTFLQEVELEFRAVQGAVYPQFDRKLHVVKPSEIPEELTIYIGMDFGYHTTAVLFVGIDKDQNWWVFDEVYGRESTLQDIIPRIKDKLADKRLVLIVGDSQAKDAIETMAKQFPIVPVVKRGDSIIHGIDLIRTKLKPRIQLVGNPKPTLFISSVCKNFIQELEAYKYPEEKKDRNPSELPMKEDDHGCFVAGTIVNGKPIESIGEYMGTKEVYEYQLGNQTVIVTPDHPILTNRGLVRIDTLRYDDVIWQKQLFTMATNGQDSPVPLTGAIGCITSALGRQMQAIGRDSTDISGEKRTVKYLLALMSIILMATPSIMSLLISAVWSLVNTKLVTPMMKLGERMAESISPTLSEPHPSGLRPKKDKPSEGSKAKKMPSTSHDIKSRETATSVRKGTLQKLPSADGVIQTVKPLRYVGVEPTYNLRTRSGMYRANGIVFSNCDALRYLVLHLKYGMQKDDKLPRSSVIKDFNDYGLL